MKSIGVWHYPTQPGPGRELQAVEPGDTTGRQDPTAVTMTLTDQRRIEASIFFTQPLTIEDIGGEWHDFQMVHLDTQLRNCLDEVSH